MTKRFRYFLHCKVLTCAPETPKNFNPSCFRYVLGLIDFVRNMPLRLVARITTLLREMIGVPLAPSTNTTPYEVLMNVVIVILVEE